jgi:hypothetical protein
MATTLQSPGINVSVIDESFYTPAGPGTVSMLFVATGQDKSNGSKTATAQGTTAGNAGKVWVITSQRDLTDTFGTPYFETDASNNPVNAGELNEYGLQAAYSLLGVSSKVYVVRADIDTQSLVPSASPISGQPANGTYWLDTSDSLFGINEWNSAANNGKGAFSVKIPLIIDNSNMDTELSVDGVTPASTFGSVGQYAVVATSDNANQVWFRSNSGWVRVANGFDGGKKVVIAPHYLYPNFTNSGTGALSASTGSVWIKSTTPGHGAFWDVRSYSSASQQWSSVTAPIYSSKQKALQVFDSTLGGANIPLKTLFVESDYNNGAATTSTNAGFRLWIRYASGATKISATSNSKISSSSSFSLRATTAQGVWSDEVIVTLTGSTSTAVGSIIASAINGITNSDINASVSATWNSTTDTLTIQHKTGGEIQFKDRTATPLSVIGFDTSSTANLYTAPTGDGYDFEASNWKPLVYEALPLAPTTTPADGTLWFDSNYDVDIMYNDGTSWVGYKNEFINTNATGPILSATQPTTQSDGITALVNGDIWVSTANPDQYGHEIYVYDGQNWNLQDVTDQTSPNGWVFHDARWATSGSSAEASSIVSLLSSDYVDPDCVDPLLYPRGTRLWNTRRSGNNIKKYHVGYIDTNANNGQNLRYQGESTADYAVDRWVTASPNNANGSGTFGRLAQRGVVVTALRQVISTNQAIRDTDTLAFNLIACPGYPEVIADMVGFNTDIGTTALVIGDTPFRLEPTGTSLTNYGLNTSLEVDNNDAAAVTYDTNLAMFYPSGYTHDNTGKSIVVPPSHMMLRTIVNSDSKSYLWFAPAGTRRGGVDNASSVGYVDAQTGEFKTASLYQGLRDVLAGVKINPIATLPGVGLVNMGQYTRAQNASSLDRINVSRLVSFLRRQLGIIAKPYLFEPNDQQTRKEIKSSVESFLLELVGQRALYDFVVVCDSSNNTPTRIDRSELWIDIAVEPVKAVEFIYIPLRLLNTGAIAQGK